MPRRLPDGVRFCHIIVRHLARFLPFQNGGAHPLPAQFCQFPSVGDNPSLHQIHIDAVCPGRIGTAVFQKVIPSCIVPLQFCRERFNRRFLRAVFSASPGGRFRRCDNRLRNIPDPQSVIERVIPQTAQECPRFHLQRNERAVEQFHTRTVHCGDLTFVFSDIHDSAEVQVVIRNRKSRLALSRLVLLFGYLVGCLSAYASIS